MLVTEKDELLSKIGAVGQAYDQWKLGHVDSNIILDKVLKTISAVIAIPTIDSVIHDMLYRLDSLDGDANEGDKVIIHASYIRNVLKNMLRR